MTLSIDDLLDAHDELGSAIERSGGPLYVDRKRSIAPASTAAVARIAKQWAHTVPADLSRFWRRGFLPFYVLDEDETIYSTQHFASVGTVAKARRLFLSAAGEPPGNQARPGFRVRARLYATGIPFSDDENYLVIDTKLGGVWQTSGEVFEVPTRAIAATFGEFLHHYIASGCFDGAIDKRLDTYRPLIDPLIPKRARVPATKNLWLRHLRRFYDVPKPTPAIRGNYFERTLATEARFYEVWIERDVPPPPYAPGWKLCTVQGGAKFGDKRGVLGLRALTGPRLEGSGSFISRAEAEAALKTAIRSAVRAGYDEVRSASKRRFMGYLRDGSRRKFDLKAPLVRG